MNHTFVGSITDSTKCRQCKRDEKSHGDEAECESCGKVGPCEIIDNDILVCVSCKERDAEIQEEISNLGNTHEERVQNVKTILAENSRIEQSIKILPDVFNAKMKSIKELADAIEQDSSVDNKVFKLAQVLDERFQHLKSVLVEARKVVAEGESEQRAIQQYYNDLAKKLRTEEREQIRLKDVQYQPVEPKITKPKSPSTKSVGVRDAEPWVEKLVKEFPDLKGKINAGVLLAIRLAQSTTIEAAYNIYRGMILAQQNKAS